jgi:glutathione S-transferase
VILQYIADLVPERTLMPVAGTFAHYRAQEWLAFIATELDKQLSPLFVRGTPRATQATLRGKVGERLGYVDYVLAAQGYLMGEHFTVCDAYMFVVLEWCPRFGIDLALWPSASEYHERIGERAAIQASLDAEGLRGRHHYLETAWPA